VALLGLLTWVLCGRMSHPWTYNDDYNGAFWSQAARNLSKAGFLSTAGVPAPLYFGQPPIPVEDLYVHHPTLLADMMLVDRAMLGESEAAARALPILFSLLTAVLLWIFVSLSMGWRVGTFALAFFVAAPMELHYGQMVNFEAPELFFMMAALCCFHLWRQRRTAYSAVGLLLCCGLAAWTDWQGYVLVVLLVGQLLVENRVRNLKVCVGLLLIAFLSGLAFLLQIHLAAPGAWKELYHAFRERSGHADLSGGSFTLGQWGRTEWIYLTTLFHPASWILAAMGAAVALATRRGLSMREAAPLQTAAILFIIDAFYVCALRNQSYIHDFASFYFLVPIAVLSGFFIERVLRGIEIRWPGYPSVVATVAGCALAGALIWSGIARLDGIDTQFCILGDDDTEPATLMPDLGRLIDASFPPGAVIICNFDRYYSPLPYYARRVMANDTRNYTDWEQAAAQTAPQPVGGIVWADEPDAASLLRQLSSNEERRVMVDGIPFVLWRANAY
jgi:hypothetical protein